VDANAIVNRFVHHPPTSDEVIGAHVDTRVNFETIARWVNSILPDCPEKEKAIDALDLAAMHTNAGIARTQLQTQSLTG